MSTFVANERQLAIVKICRDVLGVCWDNTAAVFNEAFSHQEHPLLTQREIYDQYASYADAAAQQAQANQERHISIIHRAARRLKIDLETDEAHVGPAGWFDREEGDEEYAVVGHCLDDDIAAPTAALFPPPAPRRPLLLSPLQEHIAMQQRNLLPTAQVLKLFAIQQILNPFLDSQAYNSHNSSAPLIFVNPYYGLTTGSSTLVAGAQATLSDTLAPVHSARSLLAGMTYLSSRVEGQAFADMGHGSGDDTQQGNGLERTSLEVSSRKRKRGGMGIFGLDGTADDGDDMTSAGESDAMLMIHASHIAVGWRNAEPSVDSLIPDDASTIDGNGVFLKLDDPIYKLGGKVFRANSHWITDSGEEKTEVKDVMLCQYGKCNVCEPRVPVTNAQNAQGNATPFVHSSCVQVDVFSRSHAFNVFKPRQGLRNDYARAYPETQSEQVVFLDSAVRDVLVCISETCLFCRGMKEGKKATKPLMLQSEKRMKSTKDKYDSELQKDLIKPTTQRGKRGVK